MMNKTRGLVLKRLVDVTAVLLLTFIYTSEIGTVKFHQDESQWIATSNVFEEFVSGRIASPVWNYSYWTLTQPPVTRYVIGMGRRLGGFGPQDLNAHWQFDLDAGENEAIGAVPAPDLLWWSRLPMVVLAILSVLIGMVLLHKFVGRFAGIIWIALCCTNSYFLTMLRRAMGETPLLICTMLAIFAGYKALQTAKDEKHPISKTMIWLGWFGAATGFAGAAKLNGLSLLFAGFVIVLIVVLLPKWSKLERRLIFLRGGLVLIYATGIAFIGSNPFLWRNPVYRTGQMMNHRLFEIDLQQTNFADAHIDSLAERLQVVPERIFETYAALSMDGFFWINVLLFVIGLAFCVYYAVQWMASKETNAALFVVLLVALFAAGPALTTPLDWDRYYLLPVFFSTLIIAIGVDLIVRKCGEVLLKLFQLRK